MRVWTIAVLVGLAVPAVLAGRVRGAGPEQARQSQGPRLWISHAGLTERATRGSFCVQTTTPDGGSSGSCADSAYPLPTHGRLPVPPGGRAVLRTSVDAGTVQVRLIRVNGSTFTQIGRRLSVRRLSADRWAVSLPRGVDGARLLDVSLRWNNPRDGRGDADFWAAFRQACG